MPFFGYGYNCEDPFCDLDVDNPHCHPRDRRYDNPSSIPDLAPALPLVSEEPSVSAWEREEVEHAQLRGVQPSLAAGANVDLSRIPGMELTNRGTFSYGGKRKGSLTLGEMALEIKQLVVTRRTTEEQRQSADDMLAYPTPRDEMERASTSVRNLQRATTAEEDFTKSARLAQESRADLAAKERDREPRTLPDRMNRIHWDHLQHVDRDAQARWAERERERNQTLRDLTSNTRQDSVARWAEIQAMERLPNADSTSSNQEVTRTETSEPVLEARRVSTFSTRSRRTSELPAIREDTAFCIYENNATTNENTPIETANSSPDIESGRSSARDSSGEADRSNFGRPPYRVFTGDSGFGGAEDDMSDFTRPSRVMTADSAFVSGNNSRSQSRKRGENSPEEVEDDPIEGM